MLEQHCFYQKAGVILAGFSPCFQHVENLDITPKIAKNMSEIDAVISFSEMLQTPSKGNFSLHKLGLVKRESKEADVVLQKVVVLIGLQMSRNGRSNLFTLFGSIMLEACMVVEFCCCKKVSELMNGKISKMSTARLAQQIRCLFQISNHLKILISTSFTTSLIFLASN